MKITSRSLILGSIFLLALTTSFTSASPHSSGNNANDEKTDSVAKKAPKAVDIKHTADARAMMDPVNPWSMSAEDGTMQVAAMDAAGNQDKRDIENDDDEDEDEYDGEDDEDEYEDEDEDEDGIDGMGVDMDGEDEGEDEDGYEDEDEYVDANDGALDYDDLEQIEGFHYADPLLAPMEEEQCQPASHQIQKRAVAEKPATDSKVKSTAANATAVNATAIAEDVNLSALATPEPGGACIDSFVNFALRFRERCSIQCLHTMATVLTNPDVVGLLSCFGCSNFVVQGFYALGYCCVGLLTPPNTLRMASVDGDERLGDLQSDVNPADANLYPLNFADMMKGLHQVDASELQDWFNMGQNLYRAVETNSRAAEAQSDNSTLTEEEKAEAMNEKMVLDKDLFNQFIGKAAGFANWTLTPEIIESTGVYDRLQDMNLL
ncbi:hypothetical protein BGX26_001172 [Mortierella sp. AD094]|nr:hypothetical protein BGX26_001172 [Mortierella sp. AD094]